MRGPAAALVGLALLAAQAEAEPLRIQAANAPLADFAERIAGDAAVVAMPVPAGADPATWQPGIAELSALQAADLILLNGAGLYGWTERVSLPRAKVVDTLRGAAGALIAVEGVTHSHGAEGEHSHAAVATVTWLDFELAGRQAAAVAEALARLRPDAAADFAARRAELEAELAALDAGAAGAAAGLEGQPLLAWHRGYEYLARRYGLDLETVDWDPAEPPDAAALSDLDARLEARPARLMLWAAPPGPEAAAALAARGVTPVVFDPAASGPRGEVLEKLAAGVAALAAASGPDGGQDAPAAEEPE